MSSPTQEEPPSESTSSAVGTKRSAEDVSSDTTAIETNALKKPKTQLREWANDEALSDIKIRYGPGGVKTFHGHKIILSVVSSWFRTAFTNPHFNESSAREIILEGDSERAVEVMLKYCYNPGQLYYTLSKTSKVFTGNYADKALYHLSIYITADKYDIPELREMAKDRSMFWFEKGLRRATLICIKNEDRQQAELAAITTQVREIIEAVYEATGHYGSSNHLRKKLVQNIKVRDHIAPHNCSAMLSDLLDQVAEEVPQFGSDLLLQYRQDARLGLVGRKTMVTLEPVRWVRCTGCDQTWRRTVVDVMNASHCSRCGGRLAQPENA